MTCARAVRLGFTAGVLVGALVATKCGGGPWLVAWVVHNGVDGTVRFALRTGGVQWVVTSLLVLMVVAEPRPRGR